MLPTAPNAERPESVAFAELSQQQPVLSGGKRKVPGQALWNSASSGAVGRQQAPMASIG